MDGFKGQAKLAEDQQQRIGAFKEVNDQVLATLGLKGLITTTMDSIEVRTLEAEAEYKDAKTRYARLKTLEDQYYVGKEFNEEDDRYGEMKRMGSLSTLQGEVKIARDEAEKMNNDKKEMVKAVSNYKTLMKESVNDYLYREFETEIKKHLEDEIKGIKEVIKALKDKMTGNPTAIIEEHKTEMYTETAKGFKTVTQAIAILSKIETYKLKIEQEAFLKN